MVFYFSEATNFSQANMYEVNIKPEENLVAER